MFDEKNIIENFYSLNDSDSNIDNVEDSTNEILRQAIAGEVEQVQEENKNILSIEEKDIPTIEKNNESVDKKSDILINEIDMETFTKWIDYLYKLLIVDLDMRDGILKYTYESRLLIFADFSKLIKTDLLLSNIREVMVLLKLLTLDKDNNLKISIENRPMNILFYLKNEDTSEKGLSFSFNKPSLQYLENTFIDENSVNGINEIINENNLIASMQISIHDLERIVKISNRFNSSELAIKIDKSTATFKIQTVAKQLKSLIPIKLENNNNIKMIITSRTEHFENALSYKFPAKFSIYLNGDDCYSKLDIENEDIKISYIEKVQIKNRK